MDVFKNWIKVTPEKTEYNISSCEHTERKYVAVKGKMGCGKTHMILSAITKGQGEYKTCLYIVGRTELAREIETRIGDRAIVYNYTNKQRFNEGLILHRENMIELTSVFIVCINSIETYFGCQDFNTDIVVIDEIETTMMNILTPSLVRDDLANSILVTLETKLIDATKVFVTIDAAHTEPMYKACQLLFGKGGQCFNIELVREVENIYNDAVYCDTSFKLPSVDNGDTKDTMIASILHHVYGLRKRIVIAVPYQNLAVKIKKWILAAIPTSHKTIPHVVLYTSKINEERRQRIRERETGESGNLHSLAQEADVFIYTSCISAGHSLDMDGYHSAYSFFSVDEHTSSIMEQIQMTARLRKNKSKTLYYGLITVKKNPLRGIREVGKLGNYVSKMKKFARVMGSCNMCALDGFNQLLTMNYPGIDIKNSVPKRSIKHKNQEKIVKSLESNAREWDRLITSKDVKKWRFISASGFPIYGKGDAPEGFRAIPTRTKKYKLII